MATSQTDDEDLSNLWEESRTEQQLFETSFAEGTQEAIIGQCRQCHDDGDTEGARRAQDKSGWKCQPDPKTVSVDDRRIKCSKMFLFPVSDVIFFLFSL